MLKLTRRVHIRSPSAWLGHSSPLHNTSIASHTTTTCRPFTLTSTLLSCVRTHSSSTFTDNIKKGDKITQPLRTSVYFTLGNRVGALEDILSHLSELNISLSRIESRPSRTKGDYDFYADFVVQNEQALKSVTTSLESLVKQIRVVSTGESEADSPNISDTVPWFPRKIADLDSFADKVLSYGGELEGDHPGFSDPVYRARRAEITTIAKTYRHGAQLPHITYTAAEIATWDAVYEKLHSFYATHACYEHRYVFPLLEQNCGYRKGNIPQLQEVSSFLKDCTGWTIRPVMGLLSSRDFLNGLAFRVFHSTQYIRHHSKPLYTPEPDICHELLGHVPLYADPEFADFSQEIGLASLGASDEDIQKLATIYWFTVEFGLCREGDKIKAYGAGLLSSFGELEYCLTDVPRKVPFDLHRMAIQPYPITEYQPLYFVAESFKDMKEQVRDYASKMKRPFVLRYNSLTQSIEVLDSKDKVLRYAQNIKGELGRLIACVEKL